MLASRRGGRRGVRWPSGIPSLSNKARNLSEGMRHWLPSRITGILPCLMARRTDFKVPASAPGQPSAPSSKTTFCGSPETSPMMRLPRSFRRAESGELEMTVGRVLLSVIAARVGMLGNLPSSTLLAPRTPTGTTPSGSKSKRKKSSLHENGARREASSAPVKTSNMPSVFRAQHTTRHRLKSLPSSVLNSTPTSPLRELFGPA